MDFSIIEEAVGAALVAQVALAVVIEHGHVGFAKEAADAKLDRFAGKCRIGIRKEPDKGRRPEQREPRGARSRHRSVMRVAASARRGSPPAGSRRSVRHARRTW